MQHRFFPVADSRHQWPRRRTVPSVLGAGRAWRAGSVALLAAAIAAVGMLSTAAASASTLASGAHASVTGCAQHPGACGFPDAANTGVPAGMALKRVPGQVSGGRGWHWDPRGWVEVTGDGAVLRGLSIRGDVNITASDVTIADDRIVSGGPNSFGISLRHTRNVTVRRCTIHGGGPASGRLMVGVKDILGNSAGTRVLGNNIYYASTGVHMSDGLIRGNYIHDMGYRPGDHLNGISSNGGSTALLTIQHNTILNRFGQTDAVSLFQDFGRQGNRVITGNLLAGGGYTIYAGGGKQGTPPPFKIRITNNRISTVYYPAGGKYGPLAYYTPGHGNSWSGNVWDSTGQAIPLPS
jgi:hypothetical protein